jgi:hypothetical protein
MQKRYKKKQQPQKLKFSRFRGFPVFDLRNLNKNSKKTQTRNDRIGILYIWPWYVLYKNKNKNIYYSNQWAHNRGTQIAYIDYCHWRQLYIYI